MTAHPELQGASDEDGAPFFSERRRRMQRVVVWVGIVVLVLPGVLVAAGVAQSTANRTCAAYVGYLKPDAAGYAAPFELFGAGGPGWQCYAVSSSGPHTLVGPLGLIPSAPRPHEGVAT